MKFTRPLLLAALMVCGLFLTSLTDARAAGPNPVVIMETSMGRIMVMLYPKDAPKTVANFLKYVDAGFYNGTIFHRVIKTKARMKQGVLTKQSQEGMNIVQGGGFTPDMQRRPALFPPVVNEAATGLMNEEGTIAMARKTDPNSATSEFYFNVKDNPSFDPVQKYSQTGAGSYDSERNAGYCAFGKVIRGMDVVEKIQAVKTINRGRMDDVPASPVLIKKVYRAR